MNFIKARLRVKIHGDKDSDSNESSEDIYSSEDIEDAKDDVCADLYFEHQKFYVTIYANTDYENAEIVVRGYNLKSLREIS